METAESIIKGQIRKLGPMDIGQFMQIALGHPRCGYYMTRDPLGRDGDFITAPEISQLFGEMIAVCLAEAWIRVGRPNIHLVELGPGRGTLMADIMRATQHASGFRNRVQIHLVETSPALRAAQKAKLKDFQPVWHDSADTLPADAPLVIVANEFFDALPIRQAIMTPRGWHERVVGLEGDNLVFGTKAAPLPLPFQKPGTIIEFSPVRDAVMETIAARLQKQAGLMLVIDYGHDVPGATGDTFQAVRKHGYSPPLEHVGQADLTSHVDFARLADIAAKAGCKIFGPVAQKAFLENIGINVRLEEFRKNNPDIAVLEAGARRITEDGGMGTLFRVLGVAGNVSFCPFQPAGFQSLS